MTRIRHNHTPQTNTAPQERGNERKQEHDNQKTTKVKNIAYLKLLNKRKKGYPNDAAYTKTSGLCVPYVGHCSTAKLK